MNTTPNQFSDVRKMSTFIPKTTFPAQKMNFCSSQHKMCSNPSVIVHELIYNRKIQTVEEIETSKLSAAQASALHATTVYYDNFREALEDMHLSQHEQERAEEEFHQKLDDYFDLMMWFGTESTDDDYEHPKSLALEKLEDEIIDTIAAMKEEVKRLQTKTPKVQSSS